MSSAPDPQLQRALTALRALEPPSNGFEARLRGSLLQAAADPALFPRRLPAPARAAPVRLASSQPWRKRPLAVLSLAALSLAGIAAAVTGGGWLWQRGDGAGAPVLSAEPSRGPISRSASPEPAPESPKALEVPSSEPAPAPPRLVVPPRAERVSIPRPVRPHREPPARDPSSSSAPALRSAEPERAQAPVVVPRFDLPDLPAQGTEHGSAPRAERSERGGNRLPSTDDRSRMLDRVSETRDRAAERRRQVDRPRPILEPPPALERDRRGPSDARDREREQPEPRESEGGRGRR